MTRPKIIVHRDQIYDPSQEKWVNKELPTVTIKNAVSYRTADPTANTALLVDTDLTTNTGISTADGYGEVGRLTYLRIENHSADEIHLYVISGDPTPTDDSYAIEYITLVDGGIYEFNGNAHDTFRTVEFTFGVYVAKDITMALLDANCINISYEYVKRSVKR